MALSFLPGKPTSQQRDGTTVKAETVSMDEAIRKKSLRGSITKTVIIYFLIQSLIFSAFALSGGFFDAFWIQFFCTSGSFHIIFYALLILFQDDFRKEKTQEKLASMNLANKITLIRLSTLPTLLYLVIAAKSHRIRYPLLVLVICIFATDFLDGYISRKANEVTKIGRMMDSASDYSLLIVLTVVFHYYVMIPKWFLILVLARLGIQMLFMAILIIVRKRIEPTSTLMGKVAVASIMIVYSIQVLGLIVGGLPPLLMKIIEWIAAAILVVSIGDKIISFVSTLKEMKQERRITDGDDKERP